MTKSLPPKPSVKFLKLEAKSILKAHKQGDTSCCEILRHLNQFKGKSDQEIFNTQASLQEVQFALAIEYGFRTWNEMKKWVDEQEIRKILSMTPNTEKFTGFADKYQNRPDYPVEFMDIIKNELNISVDSTIADVGAGTGILSKLLLDSGYPVYAVEPNADMRRSMEYELSNYSKLTIVDAPAENTTLVNSSVDLITVAQALHLFNIPEVKREFIRILCGQAPVVLVWNFGDLNSEYHRDYLKGLAEYGTRPYPYDEKTVGEVPPKHLQLVKSLLGKNYNLRILKHYKEFSKDEYVAYRFSSIELPWQEHPRYQTALKGVCSIFDKYQKDGIISIELHARVYWGFLK